MFSSSSTTPVRRSPAADRARVGGGRFPAASARRRSNIVASLATGAADDANRQGGVFGWCTPHRAIIDCMSIDDPQELEALSRAGAVVAATLRDVPPQVRPGITTAELDATAERIFAGARRPLRPEPRLRLPRLDLHQRQRRDRPRHPRPAAPARGDLVKLDVTAEMDGYIADACGPSRSARRRRAPRG